MILLDRASFNKPDSTTVPGKTDGGRALTAVTGTWGTVGGQCYTSVQGTTGGSGQGPILTADFGVSDGRISMHNTNGTATTALQRALVFRYSSDSNYWLWMQYRAGTFNDYLGKVVAGATTYVYTSAGRSDYTTPHFFQVELRGSSIVALIDGVVQASTTDTFNQTATKHGMNFYNSDVNWFRVDDLEVSVSDRKVTPRRRRF